MRTTRGSAAGAVVMVLALSSCQAEAPETPVAQPEGSCTDTTLEAIDGAGTVQPVPTGPDARPEPVTARPASDFVDSVGVNIHMTYTDTPYIDHDRLLEVLEDSGIRHVRDGVIPGTESLQNDFLGRLGDQGGCAQMILGGERVDDDGLARGIELIRDNAEVIAGVEGPNELDLKDIDDWEDLARDQQELVAERFGQDSTLSGIPIASLSVGRVNAFDGPGDVSDSVDMTNLHPYPGGNPPEGEIEPHLRAARALDEDAPAVITETGYHDALGDDRSQPGVPEDVEAVYQPRLLLDAFDKGVVRTYLYELLDAFDDSDEENDQASFGLYRHDWSPKPAAVSVSSLLELLSSTPSTDSRELEIAVETAEDADVRSLLLADDSGYWLALWQPVSVYDNDDDEVIDVADEPVTVVLGESVDVETYRPVEGTAVQTESRDARQIDVDVPAEPVLLRIRP